MDSFFSLRRDFPILERVINGCPLVYLDNAATSLKPQPVIDALVNYYSNYGSNIFRGVYTMAEETTTLYETARSKVAHFINANSKEIIFTKGSTEGINAIASTWCLDNVRPGDEILITAAEHHANFVPWQQCALQSGAALKILPVNLDGTLKINQLDSFLTKKTKLVAISHVSNVLGIEHDIKTVINAAHLAGAKVLVDAAQSIPHQKIDVKLLGCDFLVFSGHKMMGPTGIGVLYMNENIIQQVRPYQYGGAMISHVSLQTSSWAEAPSKYEAGTPPIAAAIGLGTAIDYIQTHIEYCQLEKHETNLLSRLIDGLQTLKKVKINGPVDQLKKKGHIVSFNIIGIHPHDVAAYVDKFGICIRAGFQCAQPLIEMCGIGPSLRASLYAYNTEQDIDCLLTNLDKLTGELEDRTCVHGF